MLTAVCPNCQNEIPPCCLEAARLGPDPEAELMAVIDRLLRLVAYGEIEDPETKQLALDHLHDIRLLLADDTKERSYEDLENGGA
jgi:hypothetical protein